MVTIGIDLSINSTGICVVKDATPRKPEQIWYYIICSDKSLTKKQRDFIYWAENNPMDNKGFRNKLFHQIYTKESGQTEFDKSSNIHQIVHRIELILNKHKPDLVRIEGIAFGVTNTRSLAELSGLNYIVRYLLITKGIDFEIVTPGTLKKQATGNGAAKKDLMLDAWLKCDSDLEHLSDQFKLDDIADAYFLSKFKNNS